MVRSRLLLGAALAAILASSAPAQMAGGILQQGPGSGGGGAPSGAAGGDLGGTYPNPTVASVANVTTGVLPASRGGAGTITGALKGNGSGVVSQAACADLSNGATGCSTATGTSGGTIPLNNTANNTSAAQTNSAAGAASTPAQTYTGAPYAGGSTTTNFPLVFWACPSATVSTAWSASGTVLGINCHTGTFGNFLDLQLDGVSKFAVSSAGTVTIAGSLASSGNVNAAAGNSMFFLGRTKWQAPSDGVLELTNNAATGFTRLQLGGTTSSFAAIKATTTTVAMRLADDSADAPISAAAATFSGDLKTTGTIPTVSGTGSPTIATGSTDTAGEVTGGTLATSIVVTFSATKTNAPFCNVTSQSSIASFGYTISTSAITISLTATTGEVVDYRCSQH